MGDWDAGICAAVRKTDSEWEASRGLSAMLCDGLGGGMGPWEGSPRGRGYMDTHS